MANGAASIARFFGLKGRTNRSRPTSENSAAPARIRTPYQTNDEAVKLWKGHRKAEALAAWKNLITHSRGAPVSAIISSAIDLQDKSLIPLLGEIARKHDDSWVGDEANWAADVLRDTENVGLAADVSRRRHAFDEWGGVYPAIDHATESWRNGDRNEAVRIFRMVNQYRGGAPVGMVTESIVKLKAPELKGILEEIHREHSGYWVGQEARAARQTLPDGRSEGFPNAKVADRKIFGE
jgi:hypothetical protein